MSGTILENLSNKKLSIPYILENLSNKKLSIVLSIILVIQLISFFIGAFIAILTSVSVMSCAAPSPSSTEQVLAIKCVAENPNQLSIPRAVVNTNQIQPQNCRDINEDSKTHSDITFAFQLPLPRQGIQLDYSRWQQNLLTLLIPEVLYDTRMDTHTNINVDHHINSTVQMRIRLAVRNIGDKDWKSYAHKDSLKRTISCKIEANKRRHGYKYDCDLIQLFELQSLYYDYYLINLQFKSNDSLDFGFMSDLLLVEIHQNGGFTKIWLTMKTVFTFMILLTLIWFSKRLQQLHRETTLLEKTLIVLGTAITQLNIPLELLSLWFDIEFMSFLCDLRQGIFHCALLSFWIIFIGEHLLDGIHRSRLSSDLLLVEIHQNGGFTKIWLTMKTVFTFMILLTLIWFSKRLQQLHRETTLLEKTLIVLGTAITQLNIPLELLSLWFDIEFMSFLCDLRQGIFHCALLSFWIIFIGEHLLDGIHRSRLSSYYKQLSVVLVAYIALFIFDLSERGIQWFDPFFTIWEVDSRFALIFIITAI
ncbi:unnamed protein product, partial [Medioppia subpectinata]